MIANMKIIFNPAFCQIMKIIFNQKIHEATGEKRSTAFLLQNISMAIQHANAVCVLGTAPTSSGLEGLFYFVSEDER